MRETSFWLRLLGRGSAAETGTIERPEHMRIGRACPHCKGPSIIRSSKQISAMYSEQLRHCENPLCGHVWVDGIESLRTLSPSAIPDPQIRIPLSTHIKRERVVASLNAEEQLDIFGDRS